ncbi:MAG: flagellar motor switch protein FliN [Desulfonatronovibrionaceae bacterium]
MAEENKPQEEEQAAGQNGEKTDQDKLAEEWAAALGETGDLDQEEEQQNGDDSGNQGADKGLDDEGLAEEWARALADEEEKSAKDEKKQEKLSAQSKDVQFNDLTEDAKAQKGGGTKRDLDFILDIPLNVTAQLGGTQLLINELLQLGQGSVIELNKLAGEPLEILVNGKLVARGEAVVINEKFGVRLTDIISPIERIKKLG